MQQARLNLYVPLAASFSLSPAVTSLTIYQPQTICSCDDPVCDSVCREWSICCAFVCYLLLVSAPGFNTCSAPSRFNFFQMNPFYFFNLSRESMPPSHGHRNRETSSDFSSSKGNRLAGDGPLLVRHIKVWVIKLARTEINKAFLLFHTVPTWNMSSPLNGSVDRAVGKSLVWVAFIIWPLPHSVDTGSHYTPNKIKCKVFPGCFATQSPQ